MRAAIPMILLAGCANGAGQWYEAEKVERTTIEKVETDQAQKICRGLTGYWDPEGCAVRMIGQGRCVIVQMPGSRYATSHEATHCLGWDH